MAVPITNITPSVTNTSIVSNDVCSTPSTLISSNGVTEEYSKGIKLNFLNSNNEYSDDNVLPDFDTESYISGFESTVQDALVDTMTALGTDTSHPTRGTNFQSDIRNGTFASVNGLIHIANFAAVDVKTFINSNLEPVFKEGFFDNGANSILSQGRIDLSNLVPTISEYNLSPSELTYDSVTFEAYFVASDGTTIGKDITSNLQDIELS